jgi:hypothetical protein
MQTLFEKFVYLFHFGVNAETKVLIKVSAFQREGVRNREETVVANYVA